MADDSENPLIKALPPATDYISYLTLVEHNISKEQLPILHNVLQDTTLTINIGWDLVHLLLPLLPESEACLRDVARLGNPREVVLKVTELLEEIGREEEEDEDDEQADQEDANIVEEGADSHAATSSKTLPPSKSTRFSTLLSLLSILHPRIKTKYPSRFLSTSLQAILSAYTSPGLPSNTLCASAILDFTRQVAPGGSKRPTVPPRQSSSSIATLQAFQNTLRANQSLSSGSAPDPEANTDGVDAGEEALQRRLLQSFMTYVAEVYLSRMPDDDADEDAPGMCWASRYMELIQPKKIVPGRRTMSDLYSDEDKPYHERDTVVGSILAQSRDLSLSPHELLTTILKPSHSSTEPQPEEDEGAEDDSSTTLPSSPSDVPLSTSGALYILTATLASPLLFHRHPNPTTPPIDLPPYPTLLTSLLPSPSSPSLGTEPPAFLDTLFFLGLHIWHQDRHTTPSTFPTEALQQLTLLSSRLSSPRQRYIAHTLASGLLHSHPDASERLGYIRDTLQHCPYENVRAEGVGWVKDEIVDAATSIPLSSTTKAEGGGPAAAAAAAAVFLAPSLLPDLRLFLFVSPAANHEANEGEDGEAEEETFATFQSLLPFHLAVLNLVYLIFSNAYIKTELNADAMSHTIREWIMALEKEVARWERQSQDGEADGEMGGIVGEMEIVWVNCRMCLDKLDTAGGGVP